jgi:hypothetical protein
MFDGIEMPRPVGDRFSGVAGGKQTAVGNSLMEELAKQIFAWCSSNERLA